MLRKFFNNIILTIFLLSSINTYSSDPRSEIERECNIYLSSIAHWIDRRIVEGGRYAPEDVVPWMLRGSGYNLKAMASTQSLNTDIFTFSVPVTPGDNPIYRLELEYRYTSRLGNDIAYLQGLKIVNYKGKESFLGDEDAATKVKDKILSMVEKKSGRTSIEVKISKDRTITIYPQISQTEFERYVNFETARLSRGEYKISFVGKILKFFKSKNKLDADLWAGEQAGLRKIKDEKDRKKWQKRYNTKNYLKHVSDKTIYTLLMLGIGYALGNLDKIDDGVIWIIKKGNDAWAYLFPEPGEKISHLSDEEIIRRIDSLEGSSSFKRGYSKMVRDLIEKDPILKDWMEAVEKESGSLEIEFKIDHERLFDSSSSPGDVIIIEDRGDLK